MHVICICLLRKGLKDSFFLAIIFHLIATKVEVMKYILNLDKISFFLKEAIVAFLNFFSFSLNDGDKDKLANLIYVSGDYLKVILKTYFLPVINLILLVGSPLTAMTSVDVNKGVEVLEGCHLLVCSSVFTCRSDYLLVSFGKRRL